MLDSPKTKLKLKKEERKQTVQQQTVEQKTEQKAEQDEALKLKLALQTLQKQMQLLKMREILILAGFISGAAALRAAMQFLPSVEPLTFFAMLSGWLFGKKKGFIAGASSLYLSNFIVFGGQGPWTLFQALGFGIAGFLGGFLRNVKEGKIPRFMVYGQVLLVTLVATLVYEIIMNISSIPFYGLFGFVTAIPFTITHIASNLAFVTALPKAKNFVREKAGFNQIPVCKKLIEKFKIKLDKVEEISY